MKVIVPSWECIIQASHIGVDWTNFFTMLMGIGDIITMAYISFCCPVYDSVLLCTLCLYLKYIMEICRNKATSIPSHYHFLDWFFCGSCKSVMLMKITHTCASTEKHWREGLLEKIGYSLENHELQWCMITCNKKSWKHICRIKKYNKCWVILHI